MDQKEYVLVLFYTHEGEIEASECIHIFYSEPSTILSPELQDDNRLS